MSELIALDEARARVLEAVRPLPSEPVSLGSLLGRVLAEDIRSTVDVPPFDNSAMDGYAVVAGPAAELRLVDESRAGRPAAETVEPGTTVRISTGAALPGGADAVVPVERVDADDGRVRVPDTPAGANVRRAGEDIRAGDAVLPVGTVIGPAEVGVLASLGRAKAACAARPAVALVVTGDELVEPGSALSPGEIWSSNQYALAALVERAGGALAGAETVPDDAVATREALRRALGSADVVCVSGGVSVGPHDHVKGALSEHGVEECFWGVALKPGKPTWFGVREGERRTLVFGLPGNPVSAVVTFLLFAAPALRALQAADPFPTRASAVLDAPVKRNLRREQAVRCRLHSGDDGWHAEPTGPQGSHVLTSMLGAGALALIPRGDGELAAGERVEIELLN